MKTAWRTIGAVAVLSSCGLFAAAQEGRMYRDGSDGTYPMSSPYPFVPDAPYGMYGGYGYFPYDHASTFEEGLLRGQGDLLRAYGQGSYWNALAMKEAEAAYRQDLDNRRRALETYCELARLNQEARTRERGPRPTREDAIRYAIEGLPQPLPTSLFDATFGVLHWPNVLLHPEFAAERTAIDRLLPDFCLRPLAAGSGTGVQITGFVVALEGKLRRDIKSLSPMDYLTAKKFLESLQYEVHQMQATHELRASVAKDALPNAIAGGTTHAVTGVTGQGK